MLPNVTEQVIQAGSNLQLTCIFTFIGSNSENKENDVKIEWHIPYNLPVSLWILMERFNENNLIRFFLFHLSNCDRLLSLSLHVILHKK